MIRISIIYKNIKNLKQKAWYLSIVLLNYHSNDIQLILILIKLLQKLI